MHEFPVTTVDTVVCPSSKQHSPICWKPFLCTLSPCGSREADFPLGCEHHLGLVLEITASHSPTWHSHCYINRQACGLSKTTELKCRALAETIGKGRCLSAGGAKLMAHRPRPASGLPTLACDEQGACLGVKPIRRSLIGYVSIHTPRSDYTCSPHNFRRFSDVNQKTAPSSLSGFEFLMQQNKFSVLH